MELWPALQRWSNCPNTKGPNTRPLSSSSHLPLLEPLILEPTGNQRDKVAAADPPPDNLPVQKSVYRMDWGTGQGRRN